MAELRLDVGDVVHAGDVVLARCLGPDDGIAERRRVVDPQALPDEQPFMQRDEEPRTVDVGQDSHVERRLLQVPGLRQGDDAADAVAVDAVDASRAEKRDRRREKQRRNAQLATHHREAPLSLRIPRFYSVMTVT